MTAPQVAPEASISFDRDGNPDWSQGLIVACFGKKRSGKSAMGRVLFDSYPYDRISIAANPTDGPFPNPDDDVFELHGTVDTLPTRWPEELRRDGRRMTLVYRPDTGSETVLEDQDAVLALARRHGDTCVLIHEIGLAAPAGRVPPHMSRLLQTNRHDRVPMILCGPRPYKVDLLVLGQADLVYIFEIQVEADRKRLADAIGWHDRDLAEGIEDLGYHEYLRYDANAPKPQGDALDTRVIHFDALPADVVRAATR